jgi:kynurenine formamidase
VILTSTPVRLRLPSPTPSPPSMSYLRSPDIPCPAATLGLNGVYDLLGLVHNLDASHEHLSGEYKMLVSNAFGADEGSWSTASPAHFDPAQIAE